MEKQPMKRLSISKFFKHLNLGIIMSIYILKANFQFIKILKRLYLYPGKDHFLFPNTPLLQYSSKPYRRCFRSFRRLQNVDFLYSCYGDQHAPI
jgi:hypothetical protein